jgi:hypothetical protein
VRIDSNSLNCNRSRNARGGTIAVLFTAIVRIRARELRCSDSEAGTDAAATASVHPDARAAGLGRAIRVRAASGGQARAYGIHDAGGRAQRPVRAIGVQWCGKR